MKKQFLSNCIVIALVVSINLQVNAEWNDQDCEYIECTFTAIPSRNSHLGNMSHPYIPGPQPADKRLPTNQPTSTNWCGYVAATNLASPAANSVSAVYGSWIVPSIVASSNSSYVAYWIGIDGYTSPSVEQIGTSHNYINGAPQHYAWFEMYPNASFSINNFPVTPGDVISTSIQYTGNGVFEMRIKNDTKNVATLVPTSYTTSTTAKRSSAEWIIEAPYLNSILPLADFIMAYVWGCSATINNVTGVIGKSEWQNTSLIMVTSSGATKAQASTLLQDQGSFFVTWKHQ
jgi:hypothetical protein